MCNVKEDFKFCTCQHKDTAPGEPGSKLPEYIWRLNRFIGSEDNGIMGSITAPSADMGEGLTIETVIRVLQSGNGFDFPYSPAENDCLAISRSVKSSYAYMSFLYKDGKWEEGMNPPFTTKSEEIANGEVFKK